MHNSKRKKKSVKSVEQRFAATMEALISGHTQDASTVLSLMAVEVWPDVFVKKKKKKLWKLFIHKFIVKSSDLKLIYWNARFRGKWDFISAVHLKEPKTRLTTN